MALILVLAVSQLQTLPVAVTTLAAIAGLAVFSGINGNGWRRMLHVEAFLILLFLTLPFTVPGRTVLTLGPFDASAEGFTFAALIACKVSASVLTILVLLGSVEAMHLGGALHALRVPEPIVRLFVLTVRYLSVISGEARRLQEAMRARAFRPGSNRHSWRSYGNLLGMLLVRALDRAQRVEGAMLCRGFSGRFPWRDPAPLSPSDLGWMTFAASLAVLITVADRL
ncbi:MAG: cobalt ECF transporter T component CbiQ [Gammaproteobacteria bacterium]|nr:cobalt ECF transporter T component CbiQ [Gammaproteobacteria bacterium]